MNSRNENFLEYLILFDLVYLRNEAKSHFYYSMDKFIKWDVFSSFITKTKIDNLNKKKIVLYLFILPIENSTQNMMRNFITLR